MVSLTPAIDILGVNVGFYPEVSAVGGNLFQYLGYGATVALGNDKTFNSDNGFGLLSRRGLIHTQRGLIYKVFAGVERREVDKNYTLQGKTLQTKMKRWILIKPWMNIASVPPSAILPSHFLFL